MNPPIRQTYMDHGPLLLGVALVIEVLVILALWACMAHAQFIWPPDVVEDPGVIFNGGIFPGRFFPDDNIWNRDISAIPVHDSSAVWMATGADSGDTFLHCGFARSAWGFRYNLVDGNTPTHRVRLVVQPPSHSDDILYPITPTTLLQAGTPDSEAFMIDTSAQLLYEMYHVRLSNCVCNFNPQARAAVRWDLTSNALRHADWSTADEAGLPIFQGLIRWDEVQRGVINHAFRFMMRKGHINTGKTSYIWPAKHWATYVAPYNPTGNLDQSWKPPMGARMRLKAAYDISGFRPDVQIVLLAMKKYGLFLADQGEDWELNGTVDSRWPQAFINQLDTVPANQFEFVDESSLMIDINSGACVQ